MQKSFAEHRVAYAKNLANETFSNAKDEKYSQDGWYLSSGDVVQAKAEDDVILGVSIDYPEEGLENNGEIYGGSGDDKIIGISEYEPSGVGIGLFNANLISGDQGDDTIYGSGYDFGIYNTAEGILSGGNGNDTIEGIGSGGRGQIGIVNGGVISGGNGNDKIKGSGLDWGIQNSNLIDSGNGDDIISGISLLAPGTQTSAGIVNGLNCRIDSGNGNDLIYGSGRDYGIYNDGIIDCGSGNDTVDAGPGGFRGVGQIDMGSGDDIIRGFGQAIAYGGLGFDTIEFGTGYYSVSQIGESTYLIGEVMQVTDFEAFGSGASTASLQDAAVLGYVSFT